MANPTNQTSRKAKEILGNGWCGILAKFYTISKASVLCRINRGNTAGINALLEHLEKMQNNKKMY